MKKLPSISSAASPAASKTPIQYFVVSLIISSVSKAPFPGLVAHSSLLSGLSGAVEGGYYLEKKRGSSKPPHNQNRVVWATLGFGGQVSQVHLPYVVGHIQIGGTLNPHCDPFR